MARTLMDIDTELAKAVSRRRNGKSRISILSQCIVADTALIDELLAERITLASQLTGAPSGR